MAEIKKTILIIGEFAVFHKGYTDFLAYLSQEKDDKIYVGILGNELIKKMTALEPDIRKVSRQETEKIIKSFLKPEKFVEIKEDNFIEVISDMRPDKIIILKGDKSEIFAEKYLKNYKDLIEYFDIRLRWQDSHVKEFKKEVSDVPEEELAEHRKFMAEAQAEAEKSKCWWRQVGAVAVKDEKIIFRGFNKMLPSEDECYKIGCIRDSIAPGKSPEVCSVTHAEATIISLAAKQGVALEDTTLYVTHFPCPACAKLVALAGFKKFVYTRGSSVFDGERVMSSQGIDIVKI